jgi:hypothetical protein
MKKLLFFALLIWLLPGMGVLTNSPPTYVGTFFEASPTLNQSLFVMGSSDGVTWSQIPAPAYTPCGIMVRDPSIAYDPATQKYFLVHTNNDPSTSFDFASSLDGKTWTCIRQISLSAVLTGTNTGTWAPEWVHNPDGSMWRDTNGTPHVLVAVSSNESGDVGFAFYEVHPTSADFSQWSTPIAIATGSLPNNTIDNYVVVVGETFYLFYKNETTKYIELATASELLGPYTVIQSGDWAGWGSFMEGASVISISPNTWRIYLDNQGAGIYYSESTSGLNTTAWSAKALINGPFTMQHGTVVFNPLH